MKYSIQPTISIDDLRATLVKVLSRHFRKRCRIGRIIRRRSLYSSSHPLDNVLVEIDDGDRLSLVIKDLSPGTVLDEARRIRPRFLYEPMREIAMHERILSQRDFGTPAFYGALIAPDAGRYWLCLERVTGPLLRETGARETWNQAARWLARFHDAMEPRVRGRHSTWTAHLLRYDRAFMHRWLMRAEGSLRRRRWASSQALRRRFTRLAERYERVIGRLLELPQTIIHGEFYPSNVIIRRDRRNDRVCPIDWELAAIAPGVVDLAALISGDWTEDLRRQMLLAYREALEPRPGGTPSLADLSEAVTYCQAHLCMQWLGWAVEWSPPALHERDWLRELVDIANRLDL